MKKSVKYQVVKDLQGVFEGAAMLVIARNHGMNVDHARDIRRKVKPKGAFFVSKNSLAKIALRGGKYENLVEFLTGPTCIACSDDPVAIAKILVEFAKTNEKFEIAGGSMDGAILNPSKIESLAKLPSLDELRGKIVGLLQAPASKIAAVIQAPAGQLARVVDAYAKK